MRLYIIHVYVCNKYPCTPIQISHSSDDVLQYIKKVTNLTDAELASYFNKFNEVDSDYNSTIKEFKDALKIDKYYVLDLPIKYFENFKAYMHKCDTILSHIDPCLHDDFQIVIIRTNSDGTFQDQYAEAYNVFAV